MRHAVLLAALVVGTHDGSVSLLVWMVKIRGLCVLMVRCAIAETLGKQAICAVALKFQGALGFVQGGDATDGAPEVWLGSV